MSEPTIFDFSYLRDRLNRVLRPFLAEDGQTWAIDPDEIIRLLYRSPEESVWRVIPATAILGAGEPPVGKYKAELYEFPDMPANGQISMPPRDERQIIRQIEAEYRPLRGTTDDSGSGPTYVRACAFAFEQVKGSAAMLDASNARLAARCATLEDQNDRLRDELARVRAELAERTIEVAQLEAELQEGGLGEILPAVIQYFQQEPPGTAAPPAPAPAEPAPPQIPEVVS